MKDKLNIQELIVRIAEKSGMTKKLTADLLRVLPEVIDNGLERDGEARIAGLGTFKLKWVKERQARNLKTGGSITVPAHNKVVFFPERGLKDKVNKDFKYLKYTVIDKGKEVISHKPVTESVANSESSVASPVPEEKPVEKMPDMNVDKKDEEKKEVPEYRKRKLIWWIIPLIFIVIALLIVIFYMKNCQDRLQFPSKDSEQEQVIKPKEGAPVESKTIPPDTTPALTKKEPQAETTVEEPKGFPEQKYVLSRPNHLFNVARETYGNPFLWALIYKENREKISNPELVMPGIVLVIPALEGMPDDLSRSDSIRVADGYGMLYDYYSSKGDEEAKDYSFARKTYTPE